MGIYIKSPEFYADLRSEGIIEKKCTEKLLFYKTPPKSTEQIIQIPQKKLKL
jgi:hypothetical protein